MAGEERWYFTKEDINNSPSRRCGIDAEKELSYRQQGANLIQDMGQRLQVNQLAINTAIVYLHRFYMFHSFPRFHRNSMAPAALFLAAKVEEQPRKLEHVIKVAHHCLCREQPPLDVNSEAYLEKAQELVVNENILLQTLGFDVAIDHPHTHVVKCCQLVRATRDLAQTSYFMATNSLHLTTMCLQYKPTVVACFCIYIVCKWIKYEIQKSGEGKEWFWYVDKTVTVELLEQLTAEFLAVMDKCPARLKKMISASNHATSSSEERSRNQAITPANSSSSRSNTTFPPNLPSSSRGHDSSGHHKPSSKSQSTQQQQQQPQPAPARQHRLNISEYNEKREKERRERERADRERERAERHQALAHQAAGVVAHGTLHNRAADIGGSGRLKHPSESSSSKHHSSHGNHKAHPHSSTSSSTVASRDIVRGTDRRDARRDPSIRVDDSRHDRTSDTMVDGSAYEKSKHSVTDSRHLVDSKPARTQSETVDRKLDIKQEQRQPAVKLESSKVKTEVKQEIRPVEVKTEPMKLKEEVKMPETIFNNSDINNYDFLRDSSLLEGPPAELFDSSDSESKPDITSLLDSPVRTTKLKSPVSKPSQGGKSLSSAVSTEVDQQQPQANAAVSHPPSQTQQLQQPSQERHYGTSNGSVPHQTTTQPPEKAPETSKSNQSVPKSSTSSRSLKEPRTPPKSSSQVSGSSSRKRTVSEKSDPELVPVLTKLEETKYGQALKDGSKVKIKGDGDSGEVHGKGSGSHVETSSKVTEPVLKVKLPIKIDPSRDSYSVDSHPSVPDGVSDVPESKKHKHENSHHKHKKEKKHKHKEKDKHKDKDYKEHKKEKKQKKRKERDKDRNDSSVSDNCGLKITINRKMLMPPEVTSSPKPEGGSGVKIKIKKPKTKKRDLFGASSSTSPDSSPARDSTPNQPNQPLKLKISRLHIKTEKEPRKRERDRSPGDSHTAKMPRNGRFP